jgi:hypothetical protein
VEALTKVIDAIRQFFQLLLDRYGPIGTLLIVGAFVLLTIVARIYGDRRKDRYIDALLDEKDKTIQRLAEQERNYRIHLFKQYGWADEEIDRFVMRNELDDAIAARRALEGKPPESDSH